MATVDSYKARVQYRDSDDRAGIAEFTLAVNPATVDANFLTAVDALAGTSSDTGAGTDFTMSVIESVQIVLDVVPATVVPATVGDIRDKWRLTFPSGASVSVPGRSTAGILTTTESKGEFADKTQAAFTAWFDALFSAAPAGIGAVDPIDDTTPASADLQVRATTSSRARPRI